MEPKVEPNVVHAVYGAPHSDALAPMIDAGLRFSVAPFQPVRSAEMFTSDDAAALERGISPLRWASDLERAGQAIQVDEKPVTIAAIGRMGIEAVIAGAALAFRVPATAIVPRSCGGRIVLVNHYAQGETSEAMPLPYLGMTPIPRTVQNWHNSAVGLVLTRKDASGIERAMQLIVREATDALTRGEVLFYLVTMQSLVTGAYRIWGMLGDALARGNPHLIEGLGW